MGWASAGPEIFDPIVRGLIEAEASDAIKRRVLGPLIDQLRAGDWDTEEESAKQFWDDPVIRELFAEREIFPYSMGLVPDDSEEPTSHAHAAVVAVLTDFSWHNFGLDEVGDTASDEWAHDLANEILAALNEMEV